MKILLKLCCLLIGLIAIAMVVCDFLGIEYDGHTSAVRLSNKYDKKITVYKSESDADSDGVDDQTAILEGALAYVKTRPYYESKYYDSGYPDDEYGVCTDVVGAGLKNAGYDLMELVGEDMEKAPKEYGEHLADKKIAFRRVKVLNIFFKRHAQSLTTDTTQIEEWQGGDIVVYDHHIAIVSDHRNKEGVPYIIHHSGKLQIRYEEDSLDYTKIVGHYRFPAE